VIIKRNKIIITEKFSTILSNEGGKAKISTHQYSSLLQYNCRTFAPQREINDLMFF